MKMTNVDWWIAFQIIIMCLYVISASLFLILIGVSVFVPNVFDMMITQVMVFVMVFTFGPTMFWSFKEAI